MKNRPPLAGIAWVVGLVVLALSFQAGRAVWGDPRPVGAFAEAFLAGLLHLVLPFATLFAGIFAGLRANEASNSAVLGWIVGIGVLLAAMLGVVYLVDAIPGVSWRFWLLNSDRASD